MSIGPVRPRGRYALIDDQRSRPQSVVARGPGAPRRAAAAAIVGTFAVGMLAGPLVARAADGDLTGSKEGWAAANNDPAGSVGGAIGQELGPPPTGEVIVPAENVDEGYLPIGIQGGDHGYQSLLLLDNSKIPSGALVSQYTLTMIAGGSTDFGTPTGVEVCAAADFWSGGPNQKFEELPEAQCLYGASGVEGEGGAWTFDLTSVASAWAAGDLVDNGLLIRPFDAENLQTGQGNPQSDFQLSFAGITTETPPTVAASWSEPAPEETTPVFTPAPAQDNSNSGGGFAPPPVFNSVQTVEEPAVEVAPEVAPQVAPEVVPEALPVPAAVPQGSAWYVWLLLPIGAAGAYAYARSLTWDPAPAHEGGREGATSRLINSRNPGVVSSTPSFQV